MSGIFYFPGNVSAADLSKWRYTGTDGLIPLDPTKKVGIGVDPPTAKFQVRDGNADFVFDAQGVDFAVDASLTEQTSFIQSPADISFRKTNVTNATQSVVQLTDNDGITLITEDPTGLPGPTDKTALQLLFDRLNIFLQDVINNRFEQIELAPGQLTLQHGDTANDVLATININNLGVQSILTKPGTGTVFTELLQEIDNFLIKTDTTGVRTAAIEIQQLLSKLNFIEAGIEASFTAANNLCTIQADVNRIEVTDNDVQFINNVTPYFGATSTQLFAAVLAFADDAAAGVGGLITKDVYQTDGTGAAPLNVPGIVMIKQ